MVFFYRQQTLLIMPIHISTRKLTARRNDLPDQIKVEMLNEVVEEFAREAKKELANLICKKHPDEISYITIIADRNNNMTLKKKFCCPEFDKKVSLKIQR